MRLMPVILTFALMSAITVGISGQASESKPAFHNVVRIDALKNPIQFMLQGSNAQTIANWNQAWRLDRTFPYVSYTVATPVKWQTIRTQSFASYAGMQSAIGSAGGIGVGVRVLLYDNEKWPATPPQEQASPQTYEKMFCELAHEHHFDCMTAPAPDLVVLQPGQKQSQQYLAQGYPAFSAQFADFYEIQAQGYERNYPLYEQFVQQAATMARSANPKVWVLAGLSTNPNPQEEGTPTLADFTTDIANTRASASGGFWLNIPSPGENCPNCAPPNIALAESVIQAENFNRP